jgi:hypothetical protein
LEQKINFCFLFIKYRTMVNNNNNTNNTNSTTMNLAKLKAQFKVEIIAYKQALANYTAALKKDTSPFMLIGVGTDGNLYVKQSLDESDGWGLVSDNSSGNIKSVCTGSDGQTIYSTNINTNKIMSKSSWDAPTWNSFDTGGGVFQAIAACPDGTLLGVGLDNTLYQINSDGSYTSVKTNPADGENEIGVAVGLDGSVFVCNGAGDVYKKNSYQNLQNQGWQYQTGGCCVKAMTIGSDGTFIGVGTDDQLYTKDSYTDLTTAWKGPYGSSCCVVGITTVLKNPQMVSKQSKTFWGTGPAGSQSVNTNVTDVDSCAALCSMTSGCSGATFNPTAHEQPMCWLRTGDGSLSAGLDTDYAILPETKTLLEVMKTINSKLNNTNQEITNIINSSQGESAGLSGQSSSNHMNLKKNYKMLHKERKIIDKLLKEFDDLDEAHTETGISTNQNYYTYILLAIISIMVCFLLYLFSGTSTKPPTSSAAPNPLPAGG